jgi:hypothetical protein
MSIKVQSLAQLSKIVERLTELGKTADDIQIAQTNDNTILVSDNDTLVQIKPNGEYDFKVLVQ